MKRSFFILLFSLFLVTPGQVWANQSAGHRGGGNSATASAGAVSDVDVGIGINNQPVTVSQGGSSFSSSYAEGGKVNNKVNVSPEISPEIGVEVNPGQTVAPEQHLTIDDHSVVKNKYINRQLPGMPLVGGPDKMEYFGPWQLPENPWNVIVPFQGKFVFTDGFKSVKYEKLWKDIYTSGESSPYVIQVPWGSINTRGMEMTGEMAIVLPKNSSSEDGLQVARYLAAQTGADLLEYIIGWNQQSVTGGWHVGTGTGASGVIGPNEKVGISGAGGTGFGKSYVKVEAEPFVKARFWMTNGREIRPVKKVVFTQKPQLRNHVEEKYETTIK